MKTYLDCVPCFARQALEASRRATDDEQVHEEVLRRVLRLAAEMDMRLTPPEMAQRIYGVVRELAGSADPYASVKHQFNQLALGLLPQLQQRIRESPRPFDTATRLAIAGNIIDFGVPMDVGPESLQEAVRESLVAPILGGDPDDLESHTASARSVVYVGDNAGEIVFDRLLVEQIGPEKVVFVVRGAPIINDATEDDARVAGLTDLVEVIDTGSDAPGAPLAQAGRTFREALRTCDLVISKGQGNYETLSDLNQPVFFLLRCKCPVISRDVGVPTGSLVLLGRNLSPGSG